MNAIKNVHKPLMNQIKNVYHVKKIANCVTTKKIAKNARLIFSFIKIIASRHVQPNFTQTNKTKHVKSAL